MSLISDLASIGIGMAVGEEVADRFVDDDNILGHVGVGMVTGGIAAKVTKTVFKESGIDDVLDDLFGF